MPKWIHDRAEHLLAKNPDMSKSQAFAIATQQSHALGKSPKGYGTEEGRAEAKSKYPTPGDDKKTANPGGLDSPKLAAMADELQKIAIDVRVVHNTPALGNLGGYYSSVAHETADPVAKQLAAGRSHVVILHPPAAYRTAVGSGVFKDSPHAAAIADANYASNRRHELTHYLRSKAGKLEGVGQPGLRNVLRTAREEGAAYLEGLKPYKKLLDSPHIPHEEKKQIAGAAFGVTGANFRQSLKAAYPQGARRAALSGTLKPLLPLAEKLKLVR